ncbi:glutathione S-transferase family protein [Rhizobium sp. BR 315]|uniref:glutathione S-transferase family protein n=1 Tax=Rhizobium sp. BR 315 TaxID=3040014 RepID=UPI003D3328EB
MICFYFHPSPNPLKVALFLEEAGMPYEVVPVDIFKGEQHSAEFRSVNPNSKVPAIIIKDEPTGPKVRIFDSSAILLFLAERAGLFLGRSADRAELLSWLFFLSSGLGPFSGQAVHFQFTAPEGNGYAVNRYLREAQRHYQVLDEQLANSEYILGREYTIADMSAWAWVDRAPRVFRDQDACLGHYPHVERWFTAIEARPAVARARLVGKDHTFKTTNDEETKRALFPSNYPYPAARFPS